MSSPLKPTENSLVEASPATVVVKVQGSINQRHEFAAGDSNLGTLVIPWRGDAVHVDADKKVSRISTRSNEVEMRGEEGNRLVVARLIETSPPRARITFRHAGYCLGPISDRIWWGVQHSLVADGGRTVLEINSVEAADYQSTIVLRQGIPTLFIAFAYYMAHWLHRFAPNPIPPAP